MKGFRGLERGRQEEEERKGEGKKKRESQRGERLKGKERGKEGKEKVGGEGRREMEREGERRREEGSVQSLGDGSAGKTQDRGPEFRSRNPGPEWVSSALQTHTHKCLLSVELMRMSPHLCLGRQSPTSPVKGKAFRAGCL